MSYLRKLNEKMNKYECLSPLLHKHLSPRYLLVVHYFNIIEPWWRNWLAHRTYKTVYGDTEDVSSSLTRGTCFSNFCYESRLEFTKSRFSLLGIVLR